MSHTIFTGAPTLLALLATLPLLVSGAECHGKPSPTALPNTQPVDFSAPRPNKTVTNGMLQYVGTGDDEIAIMHLWGSAYERGFAQGSLRTDDLRAFYNRGFAYFEESFEEAIKSAVPWIPKAIALWVAGVGLGAALDLTAKATSAYTGDWFADEIRGISDATGVSTQLITRVHMIGELTKGQCSMFGAWGDATPSGSLLQLRALDWDIDGPFQDYPQVTIYHASVAGEGRTFANVGWAGWIGLITGMSASALGISEIGVSFPDPSFGSESRVGIPWTYILRDILQWDDSLSASRQRLETANRTCNLILGVGDGKLAAAATTSGGEAPFNSVQYSSSVANFMNDTTLRPVNATWHSPLPQLVYHGMDWLCPGFSKPLHDQLKQQWGNLTPESAISHVMSIVQTGDLLVALYDLTPGKLQLYTSNARGTGEAGAVKAYDRQYVRIDLSQAFAIPKPVTPVALN